jgi:hypothetical protein
MSVTAALLSHQPDQLRRRHDRYDNGERATPLAVPASNGTKPKFFNDFSRARALACAQGGAGSEAATTMFFPYFAGRGRSDSVITVNADRTRRAY